MEDPKQPVIRFFDEVWNQRRLEIADELFDADCRTYQLGSGAPVASTPRGPESIRTHVVEWLSGFPDLKFTIQQMISEGDRVSTLLAVESLGFFQQLGILPATTDLLRDFRRN